MKEVLNYIIWGNAVQAWAISLAIIAGCIILAKLLQRIVIIRIRKAAERTSSTLDDFIISVLQRSAMPYLVILSVYLGLNYLWLDPRIARILHVAILFISVFFIIRTITDVIGYFFRVYAEKGNSAQAQVKQARGILVIINIIIWIIGIVFLIDNLGYDITTIVAGLGIGGIAIALAAQTILGDLFSYFVIFFDKPFETGDFIIIGDKMGTVEYIGIKTTRLRALGGEQLIVSNTDLTNSRVQNYKRMEKRRVTTSLGVIYETTAEKLKKVPGIIQKIIESQPDTQFDRAHFTGFGDFSLNFEVVYYILSADYNLYMDRQQSIALGIFEAFQKEDIGFAYPTQKLLLHPEREVVNN
jgi:small-conductance mechanosensitive channel